MNVADRIVEVNDSSQIEMVAFWNDAKVMRVHFVSGEEYLYQNVSFALFSFIIGAESVGQAFSKAKHLLTDYQKVAA